MKQPELVLEYPPHFKLPFVITTKEEAEKLSHELFGVVIKTSINTHEQKYPNRLVFEGHYAPSKDVIFGKKLSDKYAQLRILQAYFNTIIGIDHDIHIAVSHYFIGAGVTLFPNEVFSVDVPDTPVNRLRLGLLFGYFEHITPKEIIEASKDMDEFVELLSKNRTKDKI